MEITPDIENKVRINAYKAMKRVIHKDPSMDINDLIQDGYIGLIKADRSYRPDRESLYNTWIENKIKYEIIEGLRSRYKWRVSRPTEFKYADSIDDPHYQIEIADEDHSAEDKLLQKERHQLFLALLDRLPKRHRLASYLYFQDERKMRDIGIILQVTECNVLFLIKRSVYMIQRYLGLEPVRIMFREYISREVKCRN
jgi:RNA polymerase sigma factor (sigma-70 family)